VLAHRIGRVAMTFGLIMAITVIADAATLGADIVDYFRGYYTQS
jgi:hypothetical protein